MPPSFTLPKFYPILDPEIAARHGMDPVTAAEQILEGGAIILQFRHKGFFSREVFAQLECVAELCRNAGALFVVTDRADLAATQAAEIFLRPIRAGAVQAVGFLVVDALHFEPGV